jgi:hypothetical protein
MKSAVETMLASYDHNGVLGELTEKDDSALERFFREAHREAQQRLLDARQKALEKKEEVVLDCSRLSGVNQGETWIIDAEGRIRKELLRFEDVQKQLEDPSREYREYSPCASIDRARPLLARAAYNGLWSPSGTNWQPIRSVELDAQEAAFCTGKPAQGCGLVVLARRRYDSILGDIAALCRITQPHHAEHIDLGIWLFAAQETANSHGWKIDVQPIDAESLTPFTERLIRLLTLRIPQLAEPSRTAARDLLRSIEANDHYPYCVLLPLEGKELSIDEMVPGHLLPSSFDKLIEARSTQRVASPRGELAPEHLLNLYNHAKASVPDSAAQELAFPVFTWRDPFPERVGKAMHDSVEGPDGLLSKVNYPNLANYLRAYPELPSDVARWADLEESALEKAGEAVALPREVIPLHIRSKLLKGNIYNAEGNYLYDRRKRPLTVVRFNQFIRMLLSSFVRFSLSFQNTHPLIGVVMTPVRPADSAGLYIATGKTVAHMTFLSRAQGRVSIIKSGPPEIAADAIRRLIAEYAPSQEVQDRAERAETEPILTFQIGLALGPDELVSPGKPDEHTGLNERLLDRRASRAALSRHYIPTVQTNL